MSIVNHPNEIVITEENLEELQSMAKSLGPAHEAALKEQLRRQK